MTILGLPRLRVHVLVVINISPAAIVVAPRPILQIAHHRMRYSPTRTEPQKPAAQGQDRRGGAARSMGKCVAPGTKPKSQPRRGKNIAGTGPLAHMPPLVYVRAIQGCCWQRERLGGADRPCNLPPRTPLCEDGAVGGDRQTHIWRVDAPLRLRALRCAVVPRAHGWRWRRKLYQPRGAHRSHQGRHPVHCRFEWPS